jgi:cation-transporting ATPase E
LVVPTLRDYFGLTRPARIVYNAVLPTLALWFAVLAATYRFRLMDKILGLPDVTQD